MTCWQFSEFAFASLVLCAGLGLGLRLGGLGWGIAGGIVGWIVGLQIARIPFMMWLKSAARELYARSTDELRASLLDGTTLTPQLVCLEIRRRGEDTPEDLAYIIAMMESDDKNTRKSGWSALTSAWPQEAKQIRGYSPTAPPTDCRTKVSALRRENFIQDTQDE